MRFTEDLKARVSKAQKKIVLPETNSRRVLKAAERVLADGFAKIVLVGKLEQIKKMLLNSKSISLVLKSSIRKRTIGWMNFANTLQNAAKRKA